MTYFTVSQGPVTFIQPTLLTWRLPVSSHGESSSKLRYKSALSGIPDCQVYVVTGSQASIEAYTNEKCWHWSMHASMKKTKSQAIASNDVSFRLLQGDIGSAAIMGTKNAHSTLGNRHRLGRQMFTLSQEGWRNAYWYMFRGPSLHFPIPRKTGIRPEWLPLRAFRPSRGWTYVERKRKLLYTSRVSNK